MADEKARLGDGGLNWNNGDRLVWIGYHTTSALILASITVDGAYLAA